MTYGESVARVGALSSRVTNSGCAAEVGVEVTAELAAWTGSPGRFGANRAWRRRSSRLAPWGDGGAGARSRRIACCAPIHRYLPTHSVGRRPPSERPQAEPRTA